MGRDEVGGGEDIQVEGEGWAGQLEPTGDGTRGEAFRGIADEKAKDTEAGILSESCERIDCV